MTPAVPPNPLWRPAPDHSGFTAIGPTQTFYTTVNLPLRALAGAFLAAWTAMLTAAEGARRTNVIFIVADDLGYGEAGCYGGRDIPTPAIDGLAATGVRFTQGYVTASLCAPSRAALMTGRYQTRYGFEKNATGILNADPRVGVPLDQLMLPARLRAVGYTTGLVGKWHLGGSPAFHPMRRGFDEFFGFLNEGHYYVPPPWHGVTTWLRRKVLPDGGSGRWISPDRRIIWSTHLGSTEPDYDTDNPLLRSSQPVTEPEHLTDAFAREACDFIARHKSQPFFLYLAFNAVHSPLQASDRYLERFQNIADLHRRIFAAQLAHLDDSIGRVLAELRHQGVEDNTLVAFLSDNGGPTRELTSSNAPLQGGKGSLLEGGIRVPFIVRWPGRLPAGRVVDTPVIAMDLTASALAVGGIERSQLDSDGIPLTEALRADAAPRTFFWRMGPRAALRQGDWKIVRDQERGAASEWQLYHLATDLTESSNLASREPGRLRELTSAWERWSRTQAASLW